MLRDDIDKCCAGKSAYGDGAFLHDRRWEHPTCSFARPRCATANANAKANADANAGAIVTQHDRRYKQPVRVADALGLFLVRRSPRRWLYAGYDACFFAYSRQQQHRKGVGLRVYGSGRYRCCALAARGRLSSSWFVALLCFCCRFRSRLLFCFHFTLPICFDSYFDFDFYLSAACNFAFFPLSVFFFLFLFVSFPFVFLQLATCTQLVISSSSFDELLATSFFAYPFPGEGGKRKEGARFGRTGRVT